MHSKIIKQGLKVVKQGLKACDAKQADSTDMREKMHAGQVKKHRKCSFTVKSITAPGWLPDFWDVGEREGRAYIRKVGVVGGEGIY